jgi:hypothetical protein
MHAATTTVMDGRLHDRYSHEALAGTILLPSRPTAN